MAVHGLKDEPYGFCRGVLDILHLLEGVGKWLEVGQGVVLPGITHLPWAHIQTTALMYFQSLKSNIPAAMQRRLGQNTDRNL
jgi:hypothetical protein